jgi:hypothetical protein
MKTTAGARWFEDLASQPAFCFTSDTDWAPESMIADCFALFRRAGVPFTPFLTHRSEAVAHAFRGREADVGLHPNFNPGSTHGKTIDAVVDHVSALWPQASAFRSHGYQDSSLIAHTLYQRGLRYDSNLCLHLQSHLVPLRHWTGLTRFPVFLDDSVIAFRGEGWDLKAFVDKLRTPGLKIFNFHPVHVCLNTPVYSYYEERRSLVTDDWKKLVYGGSGVRTLFEQLLAFVAREPGLGVFTLRELYERSVAYLWSDLASV